MKRCSIEGCDKPTVGREWCKTHYYRWYYHGDPLVLLKDNRIAIERLLDRIIVTSRGCWQWTGRLDKKGYAPLSDKGRVRRAHQVSYEHYIGPIPKGLEIDHLCHNRGCVNPEHLEAVTHAVNMERSDNIMLANAAKQFCPQGHEYTPINVYITVAGGRQCRTCDRARKRRVA